MTRSIFIIGAGSHASVIVDVAKSKNLKINCLVDINSKKFKDEKKFGIDVKNLSFLKKIKKNSTVFLAIGENKLRKKYYEKYKNVFNFINLISDSSQISKYSKIGEGNFIGPNVIINARTTLGNNCIINTASVIEHDVEIGDNIHICPSVTVAGNCKILDNCFIGMGSIIIDKIIIQKNVKLGAGSLVVKNLKSNNTYYGTPAKKVETKNKKSK